MMMIIRKVDDDDAIVQELQIFAFRLVTVGRQNPVPGMQTLTAAQEGQKLIALGKRMTNKTKGKIIRWLSLDIYIYITAEIRHKRFF